MDGGAAYWVRSDPADRGRTTLWRCDPPGAPEDLTPDWDVRTTLHAYGGTAVGLHQGRACFADRVTRRVWVRESDGSARPVTPAGTWVWGGFVFRDADHVVCLREDHSAPGGPRDALVELDMTSDNATAGRVIAEGADFYFSPAAGPGGWLAWMEYDHPSMPWGSTRIVALAPDGTRHLVAGSPGVSAVHPQWDADSSLVFLSDESGYWTFHRWQGGRVSRLHDHPYDFCGPQWVASGPPYALVDGGIGCTWWQDGWPHLGVLRPDGGLDDWGTYGAATVGPATGGVGVGVLSTPEREPGVYRIDWTTRAVTPLSVPEPVLSPDRIARPRRLAWGDDGATGWYYPPSPPPGVVPPPGPAPLVVMAHGGPTAHAEPGFSRVVQFLATRGIGVLDVNYTGSSGAGRAYREALNGAWGVADVRDCVAGAGHLVDQHLADPARLAIMGGSAGGYTVLRALTTTTAFSAGISLYGIGDMEALEAETDKFESRYTQTLVAPYPAGRATYIERSPIHHVDQLGSPLLLLQGADDPVVAPNQAERMYEAVRARGLEAELVVYPGESHGFRQAGTIEDCYRRILAFLARVWGFAADPDAR